MKTAVISEDTFDKIVRLAASLAICIQEREVSYDDWGRTQCKKYERYKEKSKNLQAELNLFKERLFNMEESQS